MRMPVPAAQVTIFRRSISRSFVILTEAYVRSTHFQQMMYSLLLLVT